MTDLVNGPAKAAPSRLTLRLGALVLGYNGELPHAVALAVAEVVRAADSTKTPARMVADAMRPLTRDGVALRHEDTWYAPNLADLASWITDGLEYREDAGLAVNPELPAGVRPRIPAQAKGERAAAAA